jgi:hypothetical protein
MRLSLCAERRLMQFIVSQMNYRIKINSKSWTIHEYSGEYLYFNLNAEIVGWMQNKKKYPYSFEDEEVPTSFDQEVADENQLTEKQKESIVHKVFIEERNQIVLKLNKESKRKIQLNY